MPPRLHRNKPVRKPKIKAARKHADPREGRRLRLVSLGERAKAVSADEFDTLVKALIAERDAKEGVV